ncbi:hypothetical protein [Shewanella sp. Isolate11]|uniref:hypothetical protein n=1 Tax=Shewanella sp. Isolate11 TaxID=2908530 RepID=UPI001EFC849C|nr:hypothetical protein [Shewanella sp. Isolate11]MCG9697852.1 hypothetical protein [Shewanella sp. Isolate11]
MRKMLRHQTLVVFTLLAMLGQVMLSNGFAMVSYAQADEMPVMQMADSSNCHETQTEKTSHCCDTEENVLPATQHCCEGNGFCKGDCNHCLVISVTGTLFSVKSWSGFRGSESIMAIQMPHFHSITLGSALRPPIA